MLSYSTLGTCKLFTVCGYRGYRVIEGGQEIKGERTRTAPLWCPITQLCLSSQSQGLRFEGENTLTRMEESTHGSSQRWAVQDGDSSGWPAWCPLFCNMVRVDFIVNIRLLNMVRKTLWLGEENIHTTEENCCSITWRQLILTRVLHTVTYHNKSISQCFSYYKSFWNQSIRYEMFEWGIIKNNGHLSIFIFGVLCYNNCSICNFGQFFRRIEPHCSLSWCICPCQSCQL